MEKQERCCGIPVCRSMLSLQQWGIRTSWHFPRFSSSISERAPKPNREMGEELQLVSEKGKYLQKKPKNVSVMVWSNYVITQENRQAITETYRRQKRRSRIMQKQYRLGIPSFITVETEDSVWIGEKDAKRTEKGDEQDHGRENRRQHPANLLSGGFIGQGEDSRLDQRCSCGAHKLIPFMEDPACSGPLCSSDQYSVSSSIVSSYPSFFLCFSAHAWYRSRSMPLSSRSFATPAA
mgnify:CR=1 FL=1